MIRVWGGHDIISHLSIRPGIKEKYGLGEKLPAGHSFDEISLEITKAVSTVHSILVSKRDPSIAIEYANALARCWMERVIQLKIRGNFFKFPRDISSKDFSSILKFDRDEVNISRSEQLILLWILFVSEKSELLISTSDDGLRVKIDHSDADYILGIHSIRSIGFMASVSLFYDDGSLNIQENIYG